jgi:hypothetical protein
MGTKKRVFRCQVSGVRSKKRKGKIGAVISSDLEVFEIQQRDVPLRFRHEEVMNYLKYLTPAGFHVFGISEMIQPPRLFIETRHLTPETCLNLTPET